MINPKKLATARAIFGWPTFIAAVVFFFGPGITSLLGYSFVMPLTVTVLAYTCALAYMIYNLIGQSRYLTLDTRHKQPMAAHIAMLMPIVIGMQGAQFSELGALDGHAMVFTIIAIATAGICYPISLWVGRMHKPLYEEIREHRARIALKKALDEVTNMTAQTRADIEARAANANYEEVEKIATSLATLCAEVPELAK